MACTVAISLSNATLRHNDLGFSSLHLEHVGAPDLDLRIENRTEYRAWNAAANGLSNGFGVINLLAPRQPGSSAHWDDVLTFAEFSFTFLSTLSGEPVNVGHTFLAFFDVDSGYQRAQECVAIRGAKRVLLAEGGSDITTYESATALTWGARTWRGAWSTTPLHCGSSHGIGDDNPANPTALDSVQKRRVLMAEFSNVSTFDVRLAIMSCCSTGRNFAFAGWSDLGLPRDPVTSPCSAPPPPPASPTADLLPPQLPNLGLPSSIPPPSPPPALLGPSQSPIGPRLADLAQLALVDATFRASYSAVRYLATDCIDGNIESFCGGAEMASNYLSVRLASPAAVEAVAVFNRPERQFQSWLGTYQIWLGSSFGDTTSSEAFLCGSATASYGVGPHVTRCGGRIAKCVTLLQTGPPRYLTIGELRAYTHLSSPPLPWPPPSLPPAPPAPPLPRLPPSPFSPPSSLPSPPPPLSPLPRSPPTLSPCPPPPLNPSPVQQLPSQQLSQAPPLTPPPPQPQSPSQPVEMFAPVPPLSPSRPTPPMQPMQPVTSQATATLSIIPCSNASVPRVWLQLNAGAALAFAISRWSDNVASVSSLAPSLLAATLTEVSRTVVEVNGSATGSIANSSLVLAVLTDAMRGLVCKRTITCAVRIVSEVGDGAPPQTEDISSSVEPVVRARRVLQSRQRKVRSQDTRVFIFETERSRRHAAYDAAIDDAKLLPMRLQDVLQDANFSSGSNPNAATTIVMYELVLAASTVTSSSLLGIQARIHVGLPNGYSALDLGNLLHALADVRSLLVAAWPEDHGQLVARLSPPSISLTAAPPLLPSPDTSFPGDDLPVSVDLNVTFTGSELGDPHTDDILSRPALIAIAIICLVVLLVIAIVMYAACSRCNVLLASSEPREGNRAGIVLQRIPSPSADLTISQATPDPSRSEAAHAPPPATPIPLKLADDDRMPEASGGTFTRSTERAKAEAAIIDAVISRKLSFGDGLEHEQPSNRKAEHSTRLDDAEQNSNVATSATAERLPSIRRLRSPFVVQQVGVAKEGGSFDLGNREQELSRSPVARPASTSRRAKLRSVVVASRMRTAPVTLSHHVWSGELMSCVGNQTTTPRAEDYTCKEMGALSSLAASVDLLASESPPSNTTTIRRIRLRVESPVESPVALNTSQDGKESIRQPNNQLAHDIGSCTPAQPMPASPQRQGSKDEVELPSTTMHSPASGSPAKTWTSVAEAAEIQAAPHELSDAAEHPRTIIESDLSDASAEDDNDQLYSRDTQAQPVRGWV